METRINLFEKGQKALGSLYGVGSYLKKSSIEQSLLELVYFRVSQINGCAFCLDMHSKDLLVKGESQQRLFVIDAWREAPFYTDRGRAALAGIRYKNHGRASAGRRVWRSAGAIFRRRVNRSDAGCYNH